MSSADDGERGSAILDFTALTVVVLVPIMLAMAVLSVVQRASYAASGAARDAARVYAAAPDPGSGAARARTAADLIFGSYEVSEGSSVVLGCSGSCLAPGTTVRATATVVVPLPALSSVFGDNPLTRVTLTSTQVYPVDEFKGVG